MGEKLTKAQRVFLDQISRGCRFEMMDLLGSEVRMAQRLIDAGFLVERQNTARYLTYELHLTGAGRAALNQDPRP